MNNSTLIHKRNKTQQKNSSNPVKLRSRSGGEDEIARWRRDRCDRPTSGEIGAIVLRAARSTIDERRDRRAVQSPAKSVLPLSLSLSLQSGLSLLSLSLSLFPKMIWSENESVKSFLGQRSKCWSTRNDFPENSIFRCCQTCGFPEIIFPQNKCTLNNKV